MVTADRRKRNSIEQPSSHPTAPAPVQSAWIQLVMSSEVETSGCGALDSPRDSSTALGITGLGLRPFFALKNLREPADLHLRRRDAGLQTRPASGILGPNAVLLWRRQRRLAAFVSLPFAVWAFDDRDARGRTSAHHRARRERGDQREAARRTALNLAGCISSRRPSRRKAKDDVEPPLPPNQFNPDPGVIQDDGIVRRPISSRRSCPELLQYGEEMVPRSLGLPRKGVREVRPYRKKLPYPDYEGIEEGEGMPARRAGHSEPLVCRLRALATLRRSVGRDALSGRRRSQDLASVFAKPAERRRADFSRRIFSST